jgi:sugar phosphate isomerase/epimerase
VHERLSINSICFWGASFPEVIAQWRKAGARRVSMMSHEVLKESRSSLKAELDDAGYRFETIAHPFLPFRPLEPRAEAWRDARGTLSQLIDAAAELEAHSIYMLTGGHGSLTWEEAAETFCEAIEPCVGQAKAAGVALAVENSSTLYADNHIAHSLRDTITLAEMADIGICIDLYACFTEAALRESIQRAAPRLQVVQISDYVYGDRSLPCRAVPGDGAVPFKRLLGWILDAGYSGAFDFELIGPRIDKEGHLAAVSRAARYTVDILQQLEARA